MSSSIQVREATSGDYEALADVMFDAVRNGPSHYTEEQRRAWVPHPRRGVDWDARLDSTTVLVAIRSGEIVGFMSLAAKGYIDFAFIRPAAQRTGVFRLLYKAVEDVARKQGQTRLWVHASLTAEPAFRAMGFTITKRETVSIGEQTLDRFEMEKQL